MVQDHLVNQPLKNNHTKVCKEKHVQFENNWQESVIKVSSEQHQKGFKPQSISDIRVQAERKVQNLQSCLRFW